MLMCTQMLAYIWCTYRVRIVYILNVDMYAHAGVHHVTRVKVQGVPSLSQTLKKNPDVFFMLVTETLTPAHSGVFLMCS